MPSRTGHVNKLRTNANNVYISFFKNEIYTLFAFVLSLEFFIKYIKKETHCAFQCVCLCVSCEIVSRDVPCGDFSRRRLLLVLRPHPSTAGRRGRSGLWAGAMGKRQPARAHAHTNYKSLNPETGAMGKHLQAHAHANINQHPKHSSRSVAPPPRDAARACAHKSAVKL